MSIFTKALKHSKPSHQIDAKIDLFNYKLKKTKLGEAIANSTGGVYSITQDNPGEPYVPPEYSDVPIGPLGDENYQQPGGGGAYNNTDDLFDADLEEPRLYVPPEDIRPPGCMGWAGSGYTLSGVNVGYINANNEFVAVINLYNVFGQSPTTPLQQWVVANYSYMFDGAPSKIWKAWHPPTMAFGSAGFTPPEAYRADGFGLVTFSMCSRSNTYQSTGATGPTPPSTTLIRRNGLGDSNYYPGPHSSSNTDIAQMGPLEVQTLMDIIKSTPNTSTGKHALEQLRLFAPSGSKNRDILIKLGIPLEGASTSSPRGDIAQRIPGPTDSPPDYVKDSIRRQYSGQDYKPEDAKNIINWQKKQNLKGV